MSTSPGPKPNLVRELSRPRVNLTGPIACALCVGSTLLGVSLALNVPTRVHFHQSLPSPAITTAVAAPLESPELPLPAEEPPEEEVSMPMSAKLVVHADRTYVVLASKGPEEWIVGNFRAIHQKDYLTTASAELSQQALAEHPWQERKFELYDARGFQCTSSISAPIALSQFHAEGDATIGEEGDYGHRYVVAAPLTNAKGACKHVTWARPVRSTPPRLSRVIELKRGAKRKAALRAFRKSAEYEAIQGEYEKETSEMGTSHAPEPWWDRLAYSPTPVYLIRANDATYYAISVSVGGCGDFYGALTQLYKVTDDGQLRQVASKRDISFETLAGAMDENLDGEIELVVDSVEQQFLLIPRHGTLIPEGENFKPITYCTC